MTTAWPREPRAAADHDLGPADPAGADGVGSAAPPAGPTRRRRPRPPRWLAAGLVLLVIPLAVALTVAAMTLLLPAPDPGSAASTGGDLAGVQVDVLDGTGRPELVRLATERLTTTEAELGRAGDAAPGGPYDLTEVVYGDPSARGRAEEVRRALGVGKIVLDRSFSDASEVTVIVGRDVGYA